ncbi:MAG: right-handed parallel beta-helix repeat-containing protein [Polyangiaceae bacterium]
MPRSRVTSFIALCMFAASVTSLVAGCSDDDSSTQATSQQPKTCKIDQGLPGLKDACVPAGVPPTECAAGFLPDDKRGCTPVLPSTECPAGSMAVIGQTQCQPVGIPSDGCGSGFESDGNGGCNAVYPAEKCQAGEMAIPGETSCHEVSPCGDGKWGNIPVDGSTQYVDAAFSGASDGSESKPWKTIQEAINASSEGAIIAVTDGQYNESISITSHAVKVWGRCPAKVEIKSGSAATSVSRITATGTELHGVALTGSGDAVSVQGATGVHLDHIWVHDVPYSAVYQDNSPASDVLVSDSLFEDAALGSVYVLGSTITIERSVMRTSTTSNQLATGPTVMSGNGRLGQLTFKQSVIDGTEGEGLHVGSSTAVIEDSLVRNVFGTGVSTAALTIESIDEPSTTEVTVRGSIFESNIGPGLLSQGGKISVERSVFRGSTPVASKNKTAGVELANNEISSISFDMKQSMISDNIGGGFLSGGVNAHLEQVIVRHNLVGKDTLSNGGVMAFEFDYNEDGTPAIPDISLVQCLVEENDISGVGSLNGTLSIESSVIQNNNSSNVILENPDGSKVKLEMGGIGLAAAADANRPSGTLNVRQTRFLNNATTSVSVSNFASTIEACEIRGTRPANSQGDGGSGLVVNPSYVTPGDITKNLGPVTVRGCLIAENRRAGIYVYTGDTLIENTVIRDTLPQQSDGGFGDGVVARFGASISVHQSQISHSARAALATWGSAIDIVSTHIECNSIDLNQSDEVTNPTTQAPIDPIPGALSNGGQNLCECDRARACAVEAGDLTPPAPVESLPNKPELPLPDLRAISSEAKQLCRCQGVLATRRMGHRALQRVTRELPHEIRRVRHRRFLRRDVQRTRYPSGGVCASNP